MIMMGDKKRMVNAILGPRHDEKQEETPSADESIQAAAQEAIDAIHAKDAAGLLEALRAIFAELDAEPHREGPHIEGDDGE